MKYSELSAEQKAKVDACANAEELAALAKEEGYDLDEAKLEEIAGGAWGDVTYHETDGKCPRCGGRDVRPADSFQIGVSFVCYDCGYQW